MNYNTPFKNELIAKMRAKNLADSSIGMYIRNLEKLNNDMPLKNLKFLQNPAEIMKKLENYKENTKRGYIISICSSLSTDLTTKAKKKLYDEYFKIMIDKNKQLKDETAENKKTETQAQNWIDWDEVKEKYEQLKEKVAELAGKKELNPTQYNTLLSYMILSLYYHNPPRRNQDYQKMAIVKSELPDLSMNYLDYDKREFIFNIFKTAKKEGQQRQPIAPELFDIVNLYLKHHPILKGKKPSKVPVPFLVYYNGGQLDKVNSITRILNKIFGKAVGSSMLRHSFLSGKYGEVLKSQKEDSAAMGHSLSQQKEYIKMD